MGMTPTVYTQEMLQSTQERLINTTEVHLPLRLERIENSSPQHKLLKTGQPIFQPYPSELVFQNFVPSHTYSLPLLLLNNDKEAHAVTVVPESSEYFNVKGPGNGRAKVAPGLTASFMVFFTPQENKDYSLRLVCVTSSERFEIPVRAIGPRAILDFKDEIRLPNCVVKASTEKNHFVSNIGKRKAKFKLRTQSPFSVTPSSGTVDVGEGIPVTVVFHPMTVGDFQEDLLLLYDTGEIVHIGLFGTCEELHMCFEPDPVELKKTYISLVSSETVSLANWSDIPLQYRWTVWPSQAKDDLLLSRENSMLRQQEEKKKENMCLPVQCEFDPTTIHHVEPQESKSLSLSGITLAPAEGEIWPKTTATFNIIFKPEEAKVYQHTLYCDVTGSESPLPLRIKGEGLGPKLKLNFNIMDMKDVFIGDKDHYEVQITNKGLIDAPFRFSCPDTTFGRCFSISPKEGVVSPGFCQTVEVTFHSLTLGSFSEDLLLTVTGQPETLTLTFRGCVVVPSHHFNVLDLNFGDVAFGFPTTQTCTLFNTSFVPMTFSLHVMGDGTGSPSVSSAKQVSDLSRKNWQGYAARHAHLRPVEFTVHPEAGTVDAMSNVTIKVTLCSNKVKKYELALAVDVEGVGKEVSILPINARCVVPELRVEPVCLDFGRCYLDLPYEQNVQLINTSSLPACYGVLDQETEESTTLTCGSSVPRGIVPPGSSKEILVSMTAHAVGRLQTSLRIVVFGSLYQPLEVVLSCIGQGPIVWVPITQLKFGSIPVLTDETRTLSLLNQSPIPAHFNTSMTRKNSFWRVEPSEGVLPPESQLNLTIVAHLKDMLPFLDELQVFVRDSRTHTISLSAKGTGTTIVSDKPLGPNLDLGTHFCDAPYQYRFKLTNLGLRPHRMFWKVGGILAIPRQPVDISGRTPLPPIGCSGRRDAQRQRLSSSKEKTMISVSPACLDLKPGSSVDMVLTASSDSPKILHERLVCDSIIGGHGIQETIMSVEVMCRFVSPKLSISSKQLNFYVKKVKGSLLPVYERLVLLNVSPLPLRLELSVTEPFSLCESPGENNSTTTKFMVVKDEGRLELWVCFDPSLCTDLVSCILDKTLKIKYLEPQQQDIVKLHAEVHLPTLQFSSTTVDFGCLPKNTAAKKTITITNCSSVPLSYHWAFQKLPQIRKPEMVTTEWDQHTETEASQFSPRPKADDQGSSPNPLHVDEVFDILPIYGVLNPHDQQLMTFSFHSHENTCTEVVAQCYVEDGPTYIVQVRVEISEFSYSIESTHLDLGSVLFYCVSEVKMCVRNTGKTGFQYSIKHPSNAEETEGVDKERGALIIGQKMTAGRPLVLPAVGYIDAGSEKQLRVTYLPGIPERFEKQFHLEVPFLEPQEIILTGMGVFPIVRVNLPQNLSEEHYRDVVQQAKATLNAQGVRPDPGHEVTVDGGVEKQAEYEELLNVEVENLLVRDFILGDSYHSRQDLSKQIQTVQLQNYQIVQCRWSMAEEVKPLKKQRPAPAVFQMIPCSGVLLPGGQTTVHVMFSPVKGCSYSRRLVVSVSGSKQQIFITAQGDAEEPQLEFCPSVLEFAPCLPFSSESKAEVRVKNLSSFPVEFYSLEFDTQYLKEEEINGYYKAYFKISVCLSIELNVGMGENEIEKDGKENDEEKLEPNEAPVKRNSFRMKPGVFLLSQLIREGIGANQRQLEMTPLTRAIDRHIQSVLSHDTATAYAHGAIAIIVYGAPLTDKSSMAASLAYHYGAVCLSVDAVITDAIQNGVSPASLSARQLYDAAKADYDQKKTAEAVINSLDSIYTPCPSSTLQGVLKAFSNRKHIYVVNLFDSYVALKKRERQQRETEEALQNEIAEQEERHLWELDQENFDALPDEEKENVTQRHLEAIQKKKEREIDQKAKEDIERRQEEEKLKERDTRKKRRKDEKPKTLEVLQTKTSREIEQSIVDNLQCEFEKYKQIQAKVDQILQVWDRVQGSRMDSVLAEDTCPSSEEPLRKKKTAVKRNIRKKTVKTVRRVQNIIPHIMVNVTANGCHSFQEMLFYSPLPSLNTILDDLSSTPSSLRHIPPVTLSVVAFPKHREQPKVHQTCFTFLNPSWQNEEEGEKNDPEEIKHRTTPKEKAAGSKRHKRDSNYKTKEKKGKESSMSISPHKIKSKIPESLTVFRWVVPAYSEVVLKLGFYSESPGIFEQVFNFELAGSCKLYQLTCRGVCTYPSICKDYRTLFTHSKKAAQEKEDLQKTYVIKPGYFEFGPLLYSKTREKYKKIQFSENSQRLVIHNNCALEAEVQFSFQHDTQATTYLFDPPTMKLKPGQQEVMTVWAFPTTPGQIKDSLVCNIKDNPEPVIINFSCWGVCPQLELETNNLNFGRILLHRIDRRRITMHNKTMLPLSWTLQGVDDLGDEFMIHQEQGVIQPNSSFHLHAQFSAKKPVLVKKQLRLEVYDVEKILGILQTENITVYAEAYDVDLKIDPATSLAFGIIRCLTDAKQQLTLTNKGKYDLAFKFTFGHPDPSLANIGSMFTVSPQSGTLLAHGKAEVIVIVCRPDKEVSLEEEPILSCQVIEPNLRGGEIIAILNIKISMQAVFSRYRITPVCDIDFGPLVYGTEKTLNFTIENTGFFPINFNLTSNVLEPTCLYLGIFSVSPCTGKLQPGSKQQINVSCVAERLGTLTQTLLIDISDRNPLDQPDGIPYRLLAETSQQLEVFDLPTSTLNIGSQSHTFAVVTFTPQAIRPYSAVFETTVKAFYRPKLIPMNQTLEFQLAGEGTLPTVSILRPSRVNNEGNPEMRFGRASVGQRRTLPLVLLNDGNIAAEVQIDMLDKHGVLKIQLPPESSSSSVHSSEGHLIHRTTAKLDVNEQKRFEVSFCSDQSLTLQTTMTVQVMDNQYSNSSIHVTGEAVQRTVSFNNFRRSWQDGEDEVGGCYDIIHFGDCHVGRTYQESFTMTNHSSSQVVRFEWPPSEPNVTFSPQVQIDMLDKHGVLKIQLPPESSSSSVHSSEGHLIHRTTAKLDVNEQKRFEVSFCSDQSLTLQTTMTVQVMDNQYSNSSIHVTGEAVQRTVSFNNFRRSWQDGEDEVGGCYDIIHFGDCHVGRTYQESFTMTNHSSSQVVRFEWPPSEPNVTFSPQIGHLHSVCSKDVTVTFSSSQPLTLKQPIRCKICQVEFKEPIEEVADWDDRHRALKRQNSGSDESQKPESKKYSHSKWSIVKRLQMAASSPSPATPSKSPSNFQPLAFPSVPETDPEPVCSQVQGSQTELELEIRAVCDYSKFTCSCDTINFKDTLLFQTTLHQLQIINVGSVQVDFSWQVQMDAHNKIADPIGEERRRDGRCSSLLPSAGSSVTSPRIGNPGLPPFSVEPRSGSINPGVTQNFNVCFSPVEVAEFQGRLICSIPNMQRSDQVPCVTVSGQSLLPEVLFELEDTDYIRNTSRLLDPSTRVLELKAVGLSTPTTRWRLSISCVSVWAGHEVEQTVYLVNAEEEPFHFSVLQSSLLSEDQQSSLSLKPMNGPVMPKNRLPLLVSFTPSSEGKFNFRLNLTVKRKLEPLILNVKADCFIMSALVQIQEQDGNLREIFTNQEETVDFGKVCISEQGIHHFLVSNLSRSILEVSFELTGPREKLQYLEVKPQSDAVQVGKQLQASMFFCPQSLCNLHDVKLIVKVKHGPTFTVSIKGVAVAPSVEFSFTKFDFGKCFLFSPGMSPSSQTLIIHNKDTKEVSIKCQFKNTAFLEVDFQPDVLGPGAVMEVPITFYPQRTCHYSRKLTFVLNGCVTRHVDIEGHGTDLKLEVKDPQQKRVKLGSLTLGQKVNKQLVLINRSLSDISFTLALKTNTPLDSKDLSIIPAGELILKSGGGSCNVEIQFSPQHCIPPFSAELQAKFASFSHPLLTIEGCCKGVEVHLDRNHVSFGAVVQHCKASTKIVMMSSGAAAARFHWQTDLPAELSIKPMKGYILPDKDVTFEMTFAPVKLSDDIRYENLSCFIEDSSPVDLTVTGSCIPASINKEGLNFACRVRSCQTQSLSVTNPSSEHCTIRPVITGEQWSAALLLTFEPNQSKTFDITYRPLTVTADGQKHLGSVFFSFPLGRGMLFNLQGTASPPKAEDTITCELPAKTKHDQVLEVNNWLSKKQSFSVLLEVVEPEKTDPTVSLKGHESIEVPALTKKDYKLSFFAYREGDYNTKVTFRNEVTGEYLFYLIYFKVRPPGVLSTIKMETPVRRVASATVDVKNPLTTDTSFTTECKCSDIKVLPQLTLPGQTKDVLRLEYLPLHVGESTSRFTLFSSDLGHFHYNLLLKALPPPAEKMVHFQAALGTCHSIPVKFINYSPIVTTYTCKTDCPDFSVDSAVHASPGFPFGSEVMVEVRFEPHQFGEVRGQLSLASEDGGEYVFPLCGVCVLPRPQGPFSIMAGGSITIPFKNVFLKTTTFYLKVDNPCFSVKEVDSIPSKKRKNILVSFEAPPGGAGQLSWSGKLTVSSQCSEGHSEQCSWVFYLQGKLPK
ncbi:PREDICTED: hydrocephalus-inducing protein homolog [Cyprinodon variegatus]|uniref:hydrocephalus-inducing protein homolog n=1 Tax=Cyprinodon variegatus TaxID=28743 RepID=UPI0007425265|nr:PREDICTED: hydrocephalus-inducing protein homolog [Cyprinodon variegatus]